MRNLVCLGLFLFSSLLFGENSSEAPLVSVSDSSFPEGDSGTTYVPFTVSLSAPSSVTVTVPWHRGIAAYYQNDFDPTSAQGNDVVWADCCGSVLFAPGEISKTIYVSIIGDIAYELDEAFYVQLGNPTNATLGRDRAAGMILNDDAPPEIIVKDVTVHEHYGSTNLGIMYCLSKPTRLPVAVDYYASDITAKSGRDYEQWDTTLSWPASENEGYPQCAMTGITILADPRREPEEYFQLDFRDPENATLLMDRVKWTIIDYRNKR